MIDHAIIASLDPRKTVRLNSDRGGKSARTKYENDIEPAVNSSVVSISANPLLTVS
jgi:hypothetical protein